MPELDQQQAIISGKPIAEKLETLGNRGTCESCSFGSYVPVDEGLGADVDRADVDGADVGSVVPSDVGSDVAGAGADVAEPLPEPEPEPSVDGALDGALDGTLVAHHPAGNAA